MTALYVLGALLLVLLAGVVLAPLLEREPPDEDLVDLPPAERKEAAVEALSELEFEYQTDKLPDEEYRRLRTHYGRIALEAEEEMEAGRRTAGGDGAPEAEAPGGAGARSPRAAGGDGGACPDCGAQVPAGARFCPRCGARQAQPEEVD